MKFARLAFAMVVSKILVIKNGNSSGGYCKFCARRALSLVSCCNYLDERLIAPLQRWLSYPISVNFFLSLLYLAQKPC